MHSQSSTSLPEFSTPPREGSPYSRHIPALDGVRGLAVIGVMCSHLFPGPAAGGAALLARDVLNYGATGVDLFFVLSGFLITGILYDSLHDAQYFRKFYARRILRIFPLYYAVVGAYAVVVFANGARYWRQILALVLYVHNTYLIAPPIWTFDGHPRIPLGHFWSLAVEEQFYLGWPFIVYFIGNRKALLWFIGCVIAAEPFFRLLCFRLNMPPASIHANVFCRADSLLSGGALALLLRGPRHDRALLLSRWALVFGIGLQVAAPFSPVISVYLHDDVLWLTYCGLLGLALSAGPVKRFFSLPFLRSMGKYSYGMYVYHVILFEYLRYPVHSLVGHVLSGKTTVGIADGMVVFVLTFVVAWLSYNVYEKQFLKLKRYFDYRLHPNTANQLA